MVSPSSTSPRLQPSPRWAYALTIFISAFLLFQVQPLISRYILPWFGGSPAVWSAAMLFFQAVLLGGYAYADWLTRRQKSGYTGGVHTLVLALACLALGGGALAWGLPLLPGAAWKPADAGFPVLRIAITLGVSVGLPYFVLSTTSPLLQAWFARQYPGRSPYALYALSNAGSFLALITYPLAFEPLLDLRTQARIWSAAFVLYTILAVWLMQTRTVKSFPATSSLIEMESQGISSSNPQRGARGALLFWVLLPSLSSALLLAVTNQLTQEVAVIPFLWVLPLSIYLLSYAITFTSERLYPRGVVIFLFGVCLLLVVYAQQQATVLGIFAQILGYCAFLLLATLALHGELYRLRPPVGQLTRFYLLSSLGSVLGSLFVNLAAPVLFKAYWELPLSATLSWALAGGLYVISRGAASSLHKEENAGETIGPGNSETGTSSGWLKMGNQVWRRQVRWKSVQRALAGVVVLVVLVYASQQFFDQVRGVLAGALISERNFYGIYRVRRIEAGKPPAEANALAHGITWHGFQFIDPNRRRTPTAYYGVNSGIGLTITNFVQSLDGSRDSGLRVGVIGLGTGTLATYGRAADAYRFYEINPGIIALAEGQGEMFSFLADSAADITVVEGDARIALEHELAGGLINNFDILAVDAFSSDSIPIHLLTGEAFDLYLAHMQPQGVLAIHISNRYLDLQPLVATLAAAHGLQAVVVASPSDDTGTYAAVWVLAARNRTFLDLPAIVRHSKPPDTQEAVRPWTDNYSNLVQFLRWQVVFRR